MNGVVKEQQRSVTPSSYLGKRKRSASPEKALLNGIPSTSQSRATVSDIIAEVKKYSIAPSILDFPLPKPTDDAPFTKKQKTEDQEGQDDTIGLRLAQNKYVTAHSLLADLHQVVDQRKNTLSQANGASDHHEDDTGQLRKIKAIIDRHSSGKSTQPTQSAITAGEVLTVRSNVEGGPPKQLFTGLRIRPSNAIKAEEIDVRNLPNGFDIVEATSIGIPQQVGQTDSRTFGEVFHQIRNQRQLEPPRSSRGTTSTRLDFQKPFAKPTSYNKDDYRTAALSAGSWLEYATTSSRPGRPNAQRPSSTKQDPQVLFKSTFSSFAPSEDNTTAVISKADRSRQWYNKYGIQSMRRILSPDQKGGAVFGSSYPEIGDDYQQFIDDFDPETFNHVKLHTTEQTDEEQDILEELSELLKTLGSYQEIRDLDRGRTPNTPVKPVGPEMDTFELLRQQLNLLVAALPPFAVAKLDGDQLAALNISTNILVSAPETAGTGQPDEGTLQRQREAQAQQAALARQAQPIPSRNSYTTSTPASSYNTQARPYNANAAQTPSMPGYAQRNAPTYNAPRPAVPAAQAPYTQTPAYQRSQQPYPNATIQQYQRMQNGYGQGGQTPYQPRPQASYQPQPQMQNNSQYGRSASPAKPLTNGQAYSTPQPQRNQYSTPATSNNLLQGAYAQANSHATIQQIKAAQQAGHLQPQPPQSQSPQPQPMQGIQQANTLAVQAQQQRQASGTPQQRSLTQTPQPSHANIAAAATASPANKNLGAVPGQIGATVQANSQPTQRVSVTPTPAAASAGNA